MIYASRNKDRKLPEYFFGIPLIRSFFLLVLREFPLFQKSSTNPQPAEIPKR
jgi:hypothetical protein